MNKEKVKELMQRLVSGDITVEQALDKIEMLPYENLGYARLDHHREYRTGFPEVVFCQGKTPGQVSEIFAHLSAKSRPVLGTRATAEVYNEVKASCPEAVYYDRARCIVVPEESKKQGKGNVLVVTAGTADMPVAEEAAVSAEVMGLNITRIYDVGVAGIHRLLEHCKALQEATVVIVVAGMEGALASVVGGLTKRPVIAVPTSIGYGANFGGLSALLAMLNSCASGVGVVNIDNGYGAATLAHAIVETGRN
ncbi:MAG TPA: nickel pincer cofactor biosynthesis protein LarB [Clostridia bacterium]|nr:nickel pincer cofactor biosynthesis protein LarB [Clostridia bacterium]